jgi:NADH-quinone oxidoreductase subunit D
MKYFKTDTIELNLGPQHPATHGVLRIKLHLDGEMIVKAEILIGYLHRGTEKIMENVNYIQAMVWTDRMDYLAPILNNFAYILAVEKLLGITPPLRAQYIRVILAEFSRIASHLVWLGTHLLDLGFMTPLMYAFREREKILDLLEEVTGQRMNNSFFRIGGVGADLPDGWEERALNFLEDFEKKLGEIEKMVYENEIFILRTKNVGILPVELAIELGVTGPPLRGSGLPYDIRKFFPYSSYDHFEFKIPTGEIGDVYDRFFVRVEEMKQSKRIIKQAIKNLPQGDVLLNDFKIVPPPKEKVYDGIEEMIHHFKIISEGIKFPKGEVYMSCEGAKGELGFYIVSDGTNKPYRVRIRPPSFYNLQALEYVLPGNLLQDAIAIIGSFDPVLGEIDR